MVDGSDHPDIIYASAPRGAGTRMTTGSNPKREQYAMGGWHSLPNRGAVPYVRADGRAVPVPDLVWRNNFEGKGVNAEAFGISLFYQVVGDEGDWTLKAPGKSRIIHHDHIPSQAEAKAMAQRDYQDRVTAALDLP